jgi:rod shape-determining protein MreD
LLIFIILVAQIRGNGEGVLCGFLCGLAQDIVSGKIFGFYSLIGITLALFLEFINRRLYRKSMFISLIFVCLYTFIYEFTVYILTVFSKGSLQFGFIFNQVIVIEAAYNSIIAIFLYSLVTRIDTLFERRVSTSRNY